MSGAELLELVADVPALLVFWYVFLRPRIRALEARLASIDNKCSLPPPPRVPPDA